MAREVVGRAPLAHHRHRVHPLGLLERVLLAAVGERAAALDVGARDALALQEDRRAVVVPREAELLLPRAAR